VSFGDQAGPQDGSAFSEAEAAEEAADAAETATSGDSGNGNNDEPGHSSALVEEADPKELLVRERDEYLLALQRTQADFENYRKRIARLQEEQSNRAAASLVEKLLPVLDALDLAEAHLNASLEVSESGKALRASRAMLTDLLAKEGLERVDQAEVPFDPSVHDAVAHSEGDCGENGQTMVEEVLRSGYRWSGQGLRAAMVRVRG
jgi:molecular chaperone GrpE